MSKAIKAGAIEISSAQDYGYGYRQGTIKDPFGHYWQIQKKYRNNLTALTSENNKMTLQKNDELYKINRILTSYNLALNLIWTITAIIPIGLFLGYYPPDIKGLSFVVVISVLPFFLSNSFLDKIKLCNTTKTYEKMGVLFIQKITQNGDIVNKIIKNKFPEYRTISYNKSSINKLLKKTYSFEKYHIMMLIIFGFTFIYALSKVLLWWAIIIFMSNLLYNIYPILLQRYIRLKLALYK